MRRPALALLSCLFLLALSTWVFTQQPSYPDQVKAIQADARVQSANTYIDQNRDGILREWIAITEINAPSKQEQERAKYIESLLRKYKVEVRYDGAGNLIATRRGTGGGPGHCF
jgi:hypothetical protein